MVLIRTMALRRMAASLLTRSLATTQLIPQAASLRQCSLLHTPAQRVWNAWTPAVASGRICDAARAISSEATTRVADAVAAEIEFEKEDYSPPPAVREGPPKPWTLEEKPGDTLLTLERQFNGETIQVAVSAEQDEDEDSVAFPPDGEAGEEDDEEMEVALDTGTVFNVSVIKGDESLVFECRSDGTYMQVFYVGLEPTGDEPEDTEYTGPVYEELDESLTKAFEEYLRERGVDEALGAYLVEAVHDKEQREYQAWLERVQTFLHAK